MRVLMISKALVQGIYQRKLELIAAHGVDLVALTPPVWKDARGDLTLERAHTTGYALHTAPLWFNGDYHLHLWRDLGDWMRRVRPQIVHIDEEPYNAAAWGAFWAAKRAGARALFFAWQNIDRRYPPPFAWGESWLLRRADAAIAGTEGAAAVLRAKGCRAPIHVIPQFGVDPDRFRPNDDRPDRPFTVGCVARLVPEKGVDLLIRAIADLPAVHALIVGGGSERRALEALAASLGVADRVVFAGQVPSVAMATWYTRFDVLAVPSRALPNWKEQFGPRATVEAMAAGVPIIGADSGAIPDVVGAAGVIIPENDVTALRMAIARLGDDRALYADLRARGRARVLADFTHEQVAAATVAVYRTLGDPVSVVQS